jgi:hypothetical protein
MTKRILTVALAAFGAVMSMSAQAAEGFMPWTDVIKMANANRDVGVTMAEATALSEREQQFSGFAPWVEQYLPKIDTNGDFMISMEEMERWMIANHVTDKELVKAWYKQ